MVVSGTKERGTFTDAELSQLMARGLENYDLDGKRVIVIIPDGTRSGPVHRFFQSFSRLIGDRVSALDFLIALGTHRPMSRMDIREHLHLEPGGLEEQYPDIRVMNHRWDDPDTFVTLGNIPASDIAEISNGLMERPVPVTINKTIFDYDLVVICGPVFPHEVVGFSGGNKYFFPGISGPEVIDVTHWLGALLTSSEIIGKKDTPVRQMINKAAGFINTQVLSFCSVIRDDEVAGLFIGPTQEAWPAAADFSAETHITYLDRTYQKVLSVIPKRYDDIWTAAKGMYKVERIVSDGGEIVLFAPHISEFSYKHGETLETIGYHTRDYFLKQWEKFKEYPWGSLAHSTHLRGVGRYDVEQAKESPRVQVSLATQISRERCEKVNLGYRDPASIDLEEWKNREGEGVKIIPDAGEHLYLLKSEKA